MSKNPSVRPHKRAPSSAEAWPLARVSASSCFGDDLWQFDIATAGLAEGYVSFAALDGPAVERLRAWLSHHPEAILAARETWHAAFAASRAAGNDHPRARARLALKRKNLKG